MANMYPKNIENYNYTESEKVFYEALKNKLSDKFSVFYSIKWFTLIDGIKKHSECDFLIFHPSYGYLTIEVKGGKEIKKVGDEWRLLNSESDEDYRVLKRSPFKQAEESMYYFKNYYEEQFGYFYKGVYGFAVAFPFYSINEDFGPEGPKNLIIDYNDLNNLEQKVYDIFNYWRGKNHNFISFSSDQQVKFINMINKRIALSAAAGSLIEIRSRQLEEVNRIQDNYIVFLHNYKQAFIIGGAGTGKTWIGIKKAKQEAEQNKKVLFLCFNKQLNEFVSSIVEPYGVDCYTFHSFIISIFGYNQYNNLFDKSRELSGVADLFDNYLNLPQYDCIIVDEAQDFNEEWAYCVRLLLKDQKQSHLYVFYDENQNIFKRNFGNAFMIDYPPFVLTENIRNTAGIYKWAVNETNLGTSIRPNTIEGVEPEKIQFKHSKHAIRKLEELLNTLIKKECVSNKSIVVLSNRSIENSILNGKKNLANFQFVTENRKLLDNEIMFRTIQGFKGLEADVVILLNHINEEPLDSKQLYVGYTRARFYLYVIEILQI